MSVIGNYKNDLGRAVPTIDTAFVGKLLGDVLGIESPIYLPTWWKGRDFNPKPYPNVDTDEVQLYADPDVRFSAQLKPEEEYEADAPVRNGQKVFGSFVFEEGSYDIFNDDGRIINRGLGGLLMPLATIVDFKRDKIVTKTTTVGGMGSVKEIFGLGDWDITIRGIIIPDDFNVPSQRSVQGQMQAIQEYHEVAGAIAVVGRIFDDRKITNIVTETLDFNPIQGRPNMMQYTIKAVSDTSPLLFYEKNDE